MQQSVFINTQTAQSESHRLRLFRELLSYQTIVSFVNTQKALSECHRLHLFRELLSCQTTVSFITHVMGKEEAQSQSYTLQLSRPDTCSLTTDSFLNMPAAPQQLTVLSTHKKLSQNLTGYICSENSCLAKQQSVLSHM